jgi:hypothetical protein
LLQQLDAQIRDCLLHAEDCARRAKSALAAQEREDFLTLERGWLLLAQSLEFSRRLELFTEKAKRLHARATDS